MPAEALDRLKIDITPIDFAAKAMLALLEEWPRGGTWHIANPRPASLRMWVEALARAGQPLRVLDACDWADLPIPPTPQAAAARLALCRSEPASYARHRLFDLFQATDISFDMSRASATLKRRSLACPPPSPDLLDRYVRTILSRKFSP